MTPPQQLAPSSIDFPSDSNKLLSVILEALLTDEVEKSAMAIKDGRVSVDRRAKDARDSLRNAFFKILGVTTEQLSDCSSIGPALKELKELVTNLVCEQSAFHHRLNDRGLEEFLHPYRRFNETLQENFAEKHDIAKFLTVKYFQTRGFRCFVQGSSLAYMLGKEIAENGREGILIHTNSTVMHLTVLREKSSQFVYAFCGGAYDPACAAWLFDNRDIDTQTRLQELFTRQQDPLTAAFVMPVLVDETEMYFRRSETANLVEILANSAKSLVVAVVGERFVQKANADLGQYFSCPIPSGKSSVNFVICGNVRTGMDRGVVENSLNQLGVSYDWIQSPPPMEST